MGLVIGLVLKGFNIALVMTFALLTYAIPLLGDRFVSVVFESFNTSMFNTLSSLILAMILANLYKYTRASIELVRSFESLDRSLASTAIPAVIGLLPMPAGAYVSATMIDPVYFKMRLDNEKRAFLNYWFRHLWVSTWPLYQNVILSLAILELTYTQLLSRTWVITIAALVSGVIMFLTIKENKEKSYESTREYGGLIHLWPFMLIAILTIGLGIHLFMSLLITITLFTIVYKPARSTIYNSIKTAIDPTIVILIVTSIIFGNAIKATNLANILAEKLENYGAVAVFAIPFAIVITTGFEFTFVALGFPALRGILLSSSKYITLAFLGGFLGAMLSPAHVCLIMSSNYFNAKLHKVYRYIIPAAVLTLLIALFITLVLV